MNFCKGKIHVITGPVGTGKSTLLHMITGLLQSDSGHINVDGMVGFVQQNPRLFSKTIAENIVYGDDTDRDVKKWMRDIIIPSDVLPPLETQVGKNGSFLSGGQRQLVMILRMLWQKTDILVLDEPTSSTDTTLLAIFVDLFLTYVQKGKTIILVSHDNKLLERLSTISVKHVMKR